MKKVLHKIWPFLSIPFIVFVFFWKVFLFGQAPIPGDFIVGDYFPWLDYKWGYQVGVPIKNPITSDVVSIVYPLRSLAVDILKNGHLPLWNTTMFGGTPLLADFQVGVLSPTMVFYFLIPKIWAWTTQILLQPILAALFTYLLLRNFGLKKIESLFAGIFYAFSGFNIIWMEWNANTLVAAFIPLLILLTDKLIKTKRLFWGVLISMAICLQIFAGYPQLVVYTLIGLAIFTFFRRERVTMRILLYVLLFILAGVFLSAVLTIPALELISNSQRKFEILEQGLIYLPWQNLVTFLAPDYFGNPATINYFGVGNYTINAGYSGVVVLILAIVGVIQNWRRREIKYFVTLFSFALIFALPTPFAIALFNSHIPLVSASSATRILILANLSAAVLAGYGIRSLLSTKKLNKIGYIFIPFALLLCVAGITLFFKIKLEVTMRNLILPISLSAIASILILLRRKLFIITLCFLAILELFRYGWKYTPFSSPTLVFPDTPVTSFFKNIKEPFRVSAGNVIPMNMLVPYNLETISGYDAVYPIWWAKLNCALNSKELSKCTTFSYYSTFELYGSHWFDLLNDEYILTINSSDIIENMDKFQKVFQDKTVSIFKNNNSQPRAFFVSDWEIKSNDQILLSLLDPSFPYRKKIIIEKPTDLTTSIDTKSEVKSDIYSSEKSAFSVQSDKDGFLFVSDAWYPGWKAKVDGVDSSIYRADYAFRAVPVHKGSHLVEFSYEPISLRIGELVSLISLVFLSGVVIYDVKRSN